MIRLMNISKRVESKKPQRAAAYEVAIANAQPVSRGDKVAYYFWSPDAGKKGGSKYLRAQAMTSAVGVDFDVDVDLYVKKLETVAKMFDEFAPRRKDSMATLPSLVAD
jgi:hypothetical protein